MPLRLAFFLAFAASMFAANTRLYLKDGDYQVVREYTVEGDRVRYYSAERGDWEEIPLELVDLKRTGAEAQEKAEALAEVIKVEKAEEEAIRADRQLERSIPQAPGPYFIDASQPQGEKLIALQQAEALVSDSTSRKILQVLTPVPIVPGKSTVEVDGKTSPFRIALRTPEFYFRLMREEQFQLIRLPAKGKNARLVANVTIMPVTSETFEEQKVVPAFKRQVDEGLYKIWPEQPLEPGEYALVEFTEGEINIQVWDFTILTEKEAAAEAKSGPAKKK